MRRLPCAQIVMASIYGSYTTQIKQVLISNVKNCKIFDASNGNVTCNGLTNGSIDITIGGGQAPFNFNWSNGFPMEDQIDLPAGSYTITAIDDINCQGELTVVIT